MTWEHHHCDFDHLHTQEDFQRYGVDLEVAVVRTKNFMGRLLSSGIDPANVSLEGFRYAKDLIAIRNLSDESLRGDVASVVIEEAVTRVGIHVSQLKAIIRRKG
jgi:hypothetical protein